MSRLPYRDATRTLVCATLVVLGCGPAPQRMPPPSLRLYLARHGQTDWNAEHRLQGWSDRHLDATGRAQAARLAERLRGVPLDRVYSSTLARSRETAEAARGTVPLESLDGLRERRLGKFEGVRLDTDSTLAAEFRRRDQSPNDDLDGGESSEQFSERIATTLRGILAQHASGAILIVGHGGTNAMILRSLLGLGIAQADSIHQANDELYLLDVTPDAPPRLWKAIPVTKLGEL